MAVGLIIMKDLNSLSKEELIKLVALQQEQLRVAEERAEKERIIAEKAQRTAEIKEQSHLKFAHGVIFMAQNLKEVNGNYLAQVEDFLSYADDDESRKAIRVLYDMIAHSLNTIAAASGQIAGFFAHGNEAMKSGETSEQAYENATRSLEELKKVRSFSNNIKGVARFSAAISKAAEALSSTTNLTVESQQKISSIVRAAAPTADQVKQTHRGRVNNISKLPEAAPVTASETSAICDKCGEPLSGWEVLIADLKTGVTQLEAGFRQQNTYKLGFCQKCGRVEVFMEPEQDHPLFPDRLISTKTILSFNQAMCIGIPLERALRQFEKDAELGSNTGSYSLYDYQRFYLKPLFKAIEKALQNRAVLVCDETPFDCLQDQGRGKIPAAGIEPKAKINYVVAVTTADGALQPATLYYYSPTRSAENIGKILSDYSFKTLVTDGYSGYKTIIKNRNLDKAETEQIRHQSCLVHLRRELLKVVLPSDLYKQLLDKSEEYVTQELQKQLLANTDGMKLHTALKAINAVFRIEAEKNAGLLNPEQARKAQAELIKYLDQMMLEASKGLVTQKGTTWVKTRNVPAAKPCVYYLNAREDFATFLGSSEIPPCTNKVERAIRGVTILRKNSLHKHSANYMEAMCMALSIDATLRENGIDPFKWLQKYSQALFKHMTAKGLSQVWKETGQRKNKFSIRLPEKLEEADKKINKYLPEKLAEDFDMQPWLDSIFRA